MSSGGSINVTERWGQNSIGTTPETNIIVGQTSRIIEVLVERRFNFLVTLHISVLRIRIAPPLDCCGLPIKPSATYLTAAPCEFVCAPLYSQHCFI